MLRLKGRCIDPFFITHNRDGLLKRGYYLYVASDNILHLS